MNIFQCINKISFEVYLQHKLNNICGNCGVDTFIKKSRVKNLE